MAVFTWKSWVRTVVLGALVTTVPATAAVTVGVDPGANWLGYMNVSNLPEDGGAYQFGSGWGTQDLVATFSGPILTLTPNTIGDPNEYWYKGGGGPGAQGNKIMDANFYVEDSVTLPGELITFTGEVLANTLVSPYTSRAFIKDFVPDYSSVNLIYADLVPGVFNISLQTAANGHHIQYGFETIGPNVWVTDVASKGFVNITAASPNAIPEPSSMALLGTGVLAALARRRRQAS